MADRGVMEAWNGRLVEVETALNVAGMRLASLAAEMLSSAGGERELDDLPMPLRQGDGYRKAVVRRVFLDREEGRILLQEDSGGTTDWNDLDVGARFDLAAALYEGLYADLLYNELSGRGGEAH